MKHILGFFATFAFILSFNAMHASAEPTVVKVGVILPLTSNLAHLATNVQQGFVLWSEKQTDPNFRFEFIFEDDQFTPKLTSTAATKLINVDKVSALISVTSTPGSVVVPIAEQNKVIHFCLTVDKRLAAGTFNFVHLYQSPEMATRLLQKLHKEQLRRVGVFRFIEDAAEMSFNEIKRQSNQYGVDVIYDQTFPAGTNDFRSIVSQTKKSPVDAIVLLALPPELETLTKQIREQRVSGQLTTLDLFGLSNEKQLFEGLWYITPPYPNADYQRSFRERFKDGADWAQYSNNVADLLLAAYRKTASGNPTTTAVANELLKIRDYPSVIGPLSSSTEGVFPTSAVVSIIKDATPQLLEE